MLINILREKYFMKKVLALVLTLVLALSVAACGSGGSNVAETVETTEENGIEIPDIADTDEETAKNLLSSNGLIPSVKYEYNDDIEQGNVIKTEPAIGIKVEQNSKVTIYISKGSSFIISKDSRISWKNISAEGKDKWEFVSPYIKEDTLYINCEKVSFSVPIKWRDTYNDGFLIGDASINDTFKKTVPVQAKYEKQSWKANEKQKFTLEIPLGDLNVSKPTDMYLRLYTDTEDKNGNYYIVFIDFTMTW